MLSVVYLCIIHLFPNENMESCNILLFYMYFRFVDRTGHATKVTMLIQKGPLINKEIYPIDHKHNEYAI